LHYNFLKLENVKNSHNVNKNHNFKRRWALMDQKSGEDVFLEHMPIFSVWYKVILMYSAQFLLFLSLMALFWWASFKNIYYGIALQIIISFIGTMPYRIMALRSYSIRVKYLKKYDKLAAQKLWFNYQSYTIPILSSSLYFPILLKTDYFLPSLITFKSHILTDSLFPIYVALPFSIILIALGFIIRKPSGGFGPDVESYLYLLYPKNGKLIKGGVYSYVRNPRYLGRVFVAIGLGVFANNIFAIIVGLIHSLAFCSLIPSENNELGKRFGNDFKNYKKNVPALFPRFGNWKNFFKIIFSRDKT